MGRIPEAPERRRRLCRRVARSDSCDSTGENAEGAKQAAPTAEGCSAQTATADRCASSKETADPRFHRGGEAGRHRGAIRAVAEVAAESLARSTATRTFFTLRLGTGSRAYRASDDTQVRPPVGASPVQGCRPARSLRPRHRAAISLPQSSSASRYCLTLFRTLNAFAPLRCSRGVRSGIQCCDPPMPPPSHNRWIKRVPKPDRRRALELLASSRNGATEAIMLAHGFTVEQMVDLCIAGLAIATPEHMIAGERTFEVVRMTITEAGRWALAK